MQRKIGEVFTTKDGVTLEVRRSEYSTFEYGSCIGCYFVGKECSENDMDVTGSCWRTIFKEVGNEKTK